MDLIPPYTEIGYDDPRSYLPEEIVKILNERFPEDNLDTAQLSLL